MGYDYYEKGYSFSIADLFMGIDTDTLMDIDMDTWKIQQSNCGENYFKTVWNLGDRFV